MFAIEWGHEKSQRRQIQGSPEVFSRSGVSQPRTDSYEAESMRRFRTFRNLSNALNHRSREKLLSYVWGKSKKSRRWAVV